MNNIFLEYLKEKKGMPYTKGTGILQELARANRTNDPLHEMKANLELAKILTTSDMLELLKRYILDEASAPSREKIKISQAEFETHFHVIQPNGRGRKPLKKDNEEGV